MIGVFFFQAEDGIRDGTVTGVQTCALPILNTSESDVYPFVFTTYRLTEHHTAGGMSRTLPYLTELQPEPFCEVSPRLAREGGLTHGDWAPIATDLGARESGVLCRVRVVGRWRVGWSVVAGG